MVTKSPKFARADEPELTAPDSLTHLVS